MSKGFTETKIESNKLYDEFIYSLISFSQNEADLVMVFSTLKYTKAEFLSLRKQYVSNKAEALYCFSFFDKCLYMLEAAVEILELRINYPKITELSSKKENSLSSLYLTEATNLVEIMEIVSGIFLSKRIVKYNGVATSLAEIGRAFEYLFNFKFGDIHKKHENVVSRRPNKRTEFLDALRKDIIEESKNRGYL